MKNRIGEKRMLTAAAGLFIFSFSLLLNYETAAAASPSAPGEEKIIFLHHSTGACVYFAANRYWDPAAWGPNRIPLKLGEYNTAHGTAYNISEKYFCGEGTQYNQTYGWSNYPFDYWKIWIENAGPDYYLGEPTLEFLAREYDVVILKHCYPVAQILADTGNPDIASSVKSLENYKLQYNALKEKMRLYPNTKFIVWTLATMTQSVLAESKANRGREFVDWIKNVWDEPNDNIYIWNFYDLETGGDGLQNKYMLDQYAFNTTGDCHPNNIFSNDIAAPAFLNLIIEVLQANHASFAEGQSITMSANTARNITLAATDADGNPLAYTVVTTPAHGTLTGSGANRTYTPSINYVGSDSFTFKANDGLIDSNTATVTITVTAAVNHAPVAVNDSYTIQEDTTLTIPAPGVLGNDSDPDGDSLTAVTVSDTYGTRTLNSDGSLTYVPKRGYTGTDTFRYKVYDGALYSNVATVSITVTPPATHAPVAVNDSYTMEKDTTLIIPAPGVLSNDSDPDGDSLTAVTVSDTYGTRTLNADGSLTYVPKRGYTGTDSFRYKVYDGSLYSNVATVSITVVAVNHAPVAINDTYTIQKDATLTVPAPGVLGNDSDPDGDNLTAVTVSDTYGTRTLNADGSLTYVPKKGYTGTDSFRYKVYDGSLYSNVVTVSIIVVETLPHAPVAVNDSYTIPKNTTLTIPAPGVLGNDSDPDGDSLTAVTVSDTNGTRTLNANGSLTYVPKLGYTGTDSFRYKVYDGSLYSNEATVAITVTP